MNYTRAWLMGVAVLGMGYFFLLRDSHAQNPQPIFMGQSAAVRASPSPTVSSIITPSGSSGFRIQPGFQTATPIPNITRPAVPGSVPPGVNSPAGATTGNLSGTPSR